MATALLIDWYRELPGRLFEETTDEWLARMQMAMELFHRQVAARYGEGTLQRLLTHPEAEMRQAAILAMGKVGTIASNAALAQRLHDDDPDVVALASEVLWSLWFRGDSEEHSRELQKLVRLRDRGQALAALDDLILRAPSFAEAYNQRAIIHFQMKQFEQSIHDCEKTLALNPHHFGAQVGMAQCYMQLRKHRAALRAFRHTQRIFPSMEGVAETIRALERALGE